jgi:hypothetical protein
VIEIILATPAYARDAVECSARRGDGNAGYWSWREINGRVCWYVGRPGKPKSELYWRTAPSEPPVQRTERPEKGVESNLAAAPSVTPLPSSEELKARAEEALRALGASRPETEPKPRAVEHIIPPPLPIQQERMAIWKMALIILAIVGAAFALPIITRSIRNG